MAPAGCLRPSSEEQKQHFSVCGQQILIKSRHRLVITPLENGALTFHSQRVRVGAEQLDGGGICTLTRSRRPTVASRITLTRLYAETPPHTQASGIRVLVV